MQFKLLNEVDKDIQGRILYEWNIESQEPIPISADNVNLDECFIMFDNMEFIGSIGRINDIVYNLYVTPKHRKKGYSTLLLDKVAKHIQKAGYCSAYLNCNSEHINYYIKHNYQLIYYDSTSKRHPYIFNKFFGTLDIKNKI